MKNLNYNENNIQKEYNIPKEVVNMAFDLYLLRIKTKGYKNLDNDIVLDFYDATIPTTLIKDKSNIKAIYGYNGSGKSAIISSISLYKYIVLYPYYLMQNDVKEMLDNNINKKLNYFEFEITYAALKNDNKVDGVYKHYIKIVKKDDNYIIERETISKVVGKTLNSESKILIDISKGEIREIESINKTYFLQNIMPFMANRLLNQSISQTYMYFIEDHEEIYIKNKQRKGELFNGLEYINLMTMIIQVFCFEQELSKLDLNKQTYIDKFFMKLNSVTDNSNYSKSIGLGANFRYLDNLDESLLKMYQKECKSLLEFISLFKPDLVDIYLDTTKTKSGYDCSLMFDYKDYQVDIINESMGIKHLVQLYAYLKSAVKGNIVFIDEMDANINGVFLNKLLEYFKEESSGQLCFTTHNFEPMDILKDMPHAIDFLNVDKLIISWVKNGHYKPDKQYKTGMTKGSPYNMESFDFIKSFGYKQK